MLIHAEENRFLLRRAKSLCCLVLHDVPVHYTTAAIEKRDVGQRDAEVEGENGRFPRCWKCRCRSTVGFFNQQDSPDSVRVRACGSGHQFS